MCCDLGRAEILAIAVANAITHAEPEVVPEVYQPLVGASTATQLAYIADTLRPKQKMIFHIDEIDVYRGSSTGPPAAAFYELWCILFDLQKAGHYVYLSGRSPEMYQMGLGSYQYDSPPLTSPMGSELWLLVLDMLDLSNITKLLTLELDNLVPLQKDLAELSELVLKTTAGVPRLIWFAIDFIRQRLEFKQALEALMNDLDGKPFVDFMLSRPGGAELITPYRLLLDSSDKKNKRRARFYLQLVTWSLLKVPIPASAKIIGAQKLGYEESMSIIEILRDLSIHVSRVYERPMTVHRENNEALTLLELVAGRYCLLCCCFFLTFSFVGRYKKPHQRPKPFFCVDLPWSHRDSAGNNPSGNRAVAYLLGIQFSTFGCRWLRA